MSKVAPVNGERDFVTDDLSRQVIFYDALTPTKLDLTLLPTEKCSFRCKYCYEDFAHGRMSRDVIEGIKCLIAARARDLKLLRIAWFGGEPLLAYDIVKEIMSFANDLAEQHQFGLMSSATTNGYHLDRERFIELERIGLTRYKVSLDGDEEWHDQTRVRKDGIGTFRKLWENVRLFNELSEARSLRNSLMVLRLHMHPQNIASVERLAQMISRSLNPRFFLLNVERVGHFGSPNDETFEVFDLKRPEWLAIRKKMYETLGDFVPDGEQGQYVCYASKANHFMIRADGSIGKCTIALNSGSNTVGRLKANGSMELNQERLEPWLHGLRSMNRDDLACPLTRLPETDSFEQQGNCGPLH